MSKLEMVLDNTLDVSETMINDRVDKYLDMDKTKIILYICVSWHLIGAKISEVSCFPVTAEFGTTIRTWIEKENLTIFFENAILDINNIKDLAGTGNVCSHSPRYISVQVLINNYTDILRDREQLLEKGA